MQILFEKKDNRCGILDTDVLIESINEFNDKIEITIAFSCNTPCCEFEIDKKIDNDTLNIYIFQKSFQSQRLCIQCLAVVRYSLIIKKSEVMPSKLSIFYSNEKILEYRIKR